jgi:hypothetical protein
VYSLSLSAKCCGYGFWEVMVQKTVILGPVRLFVVLNYLFACVVMFITVAVLPTS